MKKLAMFLMGLFILQGVAKAEDKPVSEAQLPETARNFIRQYFPGVKISYALMDKDWFDNSYDVVLVNGVKLEFGEKGDWKKVKCKKATAPAVVPAGIVPQQIMTFLKQQHPEWPVVEIEQDRKSYEVELSNGLEIKFNKQYQVIKYDD